MADRLERLTRMAPGECAFIETLEARTLKVAKRRSLARAGDPMREAFVLKSGWVISYTQLASGTRQIRRVHLPGDIVGMPSIALHRHAEDLETLTPVLAAPFDRRTFARLFEEQPRLTAIMFMYAQLERVTLGDRLASVGRMSCKQRLAYLLTDIFMRLKAIDLTIGASFEMHLTREHMAEMTGMTPIHASRMWGELLAEGLISQKEHWVTIADFPSLLALSSYANRAADLDFSWIPESVEKAGRCFAQHPVRSG